PGEQRHGAVAHVEHRRMRRVGHEDVPAHDKHLAHGGIGTIADSKTRKDGQGPPGTESPPNDPGWLPRIKSFIRFVPPEIVICPLPRYPKYVESLVTTSIPAVTHTAPVAERLTPTNIRSFATIVPPARASVPCEP